MRLVFVARLSVGSTLLVASPSFADPCRSSFGGGMTALSAVCLGEMPSLDLDVNLLPTLRPTAVANAPFVVMQSVAGVVVAPVTVEKSDNGISMRASLMTLRDYNTRTSAEKIADLKSLAPANLPLPRSPILPKSPFDLWSKFDVNGYDWTGDTATRAGLGLDYRMNRAVTAGVGVERGDVKTAATPGAQVYDKVDAHVTYQMTQLLSLNSRAQWQTGNADFATATGTPDKRSVSVVPKISKTFALANGQSISPFATYTRELDLEKQIGDGTNRSTTTTQSMGAGVTLEKRDTYTLSITTEISSLGSAEPSTFNSHVQLKLPIK